jgi:CheY-like chemotaxis protein
MRAEFAALAANKGLQLEVEECNDHVHSDPSLVGQVVRNLVANAIKYTAKGRVQLRCLHQQSLVRLEVLDTGVGIAPAELRRIYDDFYQVGVATNTSRDGYGLGLSIVSRIVDLLHLKLDVRSEVGKGSVFALSLPASAGTGEPRAPAARAPVHVTSAKPQRSRILLVEDDARVRNATRMLLKVEGYDVLAAGSLPEAREIMKANADIGLLITDYHLGTDETGVHVIAAAREQLGDALPAVLVTGDTSSAMHGLEADTRLRMASKPINPDELLALISELAPAARS